MRYTVSSSACCMSSGAAVWRAPLGGAVTHSPSVGSRLGCGAELQAATSSGWNPGVSEERRGAGSPLLESSGSLYWPTREITGCFHASVCHCVTRSVTGVPATDGGNACMGIGV